MSEIINNREYRQKVLTELILELHAGKTVDEVKGRFEKLIEGVSASEISQMEQALIAEGMPVEEVQRLCDVHAAVLRVRSRIFIKRSPFSLSKSLVIPSILLNKRIVLLKI